MSLRTGEEIFRHSLDVIRQHPKLLFFPLLTFAMGVAVVAILLPPAFGVQLHDIWNGLSREGEDAGAMRLIADVVRDPLTLPWSWVVLGWLCSKLGDTFIRAAFYSEAIDALNGGQVSVRNGLLTAAGRIRALAPWGVFASTVGVFVELFERVLGGVVRLLADVAGGSLIMRRLTLVPALLGVEWSAAAQLAVQVIIREPRIGAPFEYLKVSARMVERVWGSALVIGLFGASAVGLYVAAAVLCLSLLAVAITQQHVFVAWGALLSFAVFCMTDAVNSVYRCGLYVYATEGVAPGPFDEAVLNRAWTVS